MRYWSLIGAGPAGIVNAFNLNSQTTVFSITMPNTTVMRIKWMSLFLEAQYTTTSRGTLPVSLDGLLTVSYDVIATTPNVTKMQNLANVSGTAGNNGTIIMCTTKQAFRGEVIVNNTPSLFFTIRAENEGSLVGVLTSADITGITYNYALMIGWETGPGNE